MNMKICDAMLSDVPGIYAVDRMAAEDGSRGQQIRDWVAADQGIVAVVDDLVAGYAALEYTFFGCGFIAMVMVKEGSRRSGVATALITRLEQICKTEKLFTSTNESNRSMQALLKSMSYEASGTVYNLDDGDPELFYFKNLRKIR